MYTVKELCASVKYRIIIQLNNFQSHYFDSCNDIKPEFLELNVKEITFDEVYKSIIFITK
jgi:hypothetical protein